MSQWDVAFRAGIHHTEMSLLERYERMPRAGTLMRLSGALGSEPGELLDGLAWELDGRPAQPGEAGRPNLPEGRRRTAVPDPMVRFGLLLTRERLRSGLRQEDVGELLRMHRAEISLIERGGRQPRLDVLLQLAAAVEARPADLLAGIVASPWSSSTMPPVTTARSRSTGSTRRTERWKRSPPSLPTEAVRPLRIVPSWFGPHSRVDRRFDCANRRPLASTILGQFEQLCLRRRRNPIAIVSSAKRLGVT
jgi:transcriptional regulator with XRE-family HTH domain